MAIATIKMWNQDGKHVIVNADDTKTQEEWRAIGYEREDRLRREMPAELQALPMEEAIQIMGGRASMEPPEIDSQKEAAQDPSESTPADATPEGQEAQDNAAGEVKTEERPAKKKASDKK